MDLQSTGGRALLRFGRLQSNELAKLAYDLDLEGETRNHVGDVVRPAAVFPERSFTALCFPLPSPMISRGS